MKRGYVLRRLAEREYDDAIGWYESEREGLGQEFRATIEKCFQRIVENPELFPKVRGEIRRAVVLRPFSYVIHFLIEKECIVIIVWK